MPDNPFQLAMLVSNEHFESLARYVPTPEFLSVARTLIPHDWRLVRSDTWFNAMPPAAELPPQGWKIHVSSTREEAVDVLRKTIEVLVDEGVPFKFALDPTMLLHLNAKNWPRSGSGKFVTIYPPDEQRFVALVQRLAAALAGHRGPYVLSDRRYGDSGVVYYRYGGFVRSGTVSPTGEQQPTITAPDGTQVPDDRRPFFSLPYWVTDPFPAEPDGTEDRVLRDGRYTVERALHFSNTGGVYVAADAATGARVVVKEARPHSGGDGFADSHDLLSKEHAVLEALASTGVAPRPVELFREWEHLFLVEEYVSGVSLWTFAADQNKLLVPDLDADEAREFRERLRTIWVSLAAALEKAHAAGVVLGDLSPRNVLVDPETIEVRFIDFEATVRLGVDTSARLVTPGFASPRQRREGVRDVTDDYYALGALMLSSLFPLNTMFELDPSARERVLASVARDVRLPAAWRDTIAALLGDDPAARPAPADVVRVVEDRGGSQPASPAPVVLPADAELEDLVARVVSHIADSADYSRRDRLYPADAQVFGTNPLNLTSGAAGVAYALHRVTGDVPGRAMAWMLSHDVSPAAYPPGLHIGTAGVAWAFAELGEVGVAARLMDGAREHPRRFATHSVQSGAAGYGLAALRLWRATDREEYLADAVAAAEHLRASAFDDGETLSWPGSDGAARIGYAHGASGVAAFLLYLHLATGDERWLDAGRAALGFDLGFAVERDGVLSFPGRTDQQRPLLPYLDAGSAGVGRALVRYYAVTGDEQYRKTLDPLTRDCARRYALLPGLFHGLAGLGDLLLDCADLLGEPQFREEARRVADGVRLFAVERPAGIAFPGELLLRISADYATGSAGIALFLHRLARGGGAFDLLLDELLPRRPL